MGFLEEYSFVIGFFIVMGVLVWIGDRTRRDFSDMLDKKQKVRDECENEMYERRTEFKEENKLEKKKQYEIDDYYQSIKSLEINRDREIKEIQEDFNSNQLKEIRMSLMGILIIVMIGLFLIYNKL